MRPLRKLIIGLAEMMQVVSLLVWTIGGAWGGARAVTVAVDAGYFHNVIPLESGQTVGIVLGGLVGFAISATAAAVVFAFAQIEANTREVARYYSERRKAEAAIAHGMQVQREASQR
jgi:hypothetical protein